MKLNAFVTRCTNHCRKYFEACEVAQRQGRMSGSPRYPTMLLICDTGTHFTAELLGASQARPRALVVVHRELPSLDAFLGRFPVEPTHHLFSGGPTDVGGVRFQQLALVCDQDRDIFKSRYPELSDSHASILSYGGAIATNEAFYPIDWKPLHKDLWLDDVLTVANCNGQVRARYFQSAWIIEQGASSSELQRRLDLHHPIGEDATLLAPGGSDSHDLLLRAANFASLASIEKIGETTITRFLELNEPVLLAALGAVRLIPQPLLPWQEGNPDPDEVAIQPDFLAVDSQGYAHLCEVKLPLSKRTSLTTGGHKRRRFVSAVADGVAQLANYYEYLSFNSHRVLLKERFGVTVEDPRMILIVGSAENFDAEEVRQAQRLGSSIELLDYDTLRALYLARSGYVPGMGTGAGTGRQVKDDHP